MSTTTTASAATSAVASARTRKHDPEPCDPAQATTRSLLGYGVIAGPLYVAVSITEALLRDGFDLSRHSWSLLANGDWGWIHIANLVVTGLMMLAFSAGLRRALGSGTGSVWAPRLVGVYGAALVAAGTFRADPVQGFPLGTPEVGAAVSWQGSLHFVAGAVGFACLIAGCFVIARRFARDGRRGWARASRAAGIVFLCGFAAVASGVQSPATVVGFTAAVVIVSAWVSAVALHLYSATRG